MRTRNLLGVGAALALALGGVEANAQSTWLGYPVVWYVGPEGGWTDEELNSAESQGFALVGLGPTILKADTAAVVATALIRYELGK